MSEEYKIWSCKIGGFVELPKDADYEMRRAVHIAFAYLTQKDPKFIFSGWGAELTEGELAVVEDRAARSTTPAGPMIGTTAAYAVPLTGPTSPAVDGGEPVSWQYRQCAVYYAGQPPEWGHWHFCSKASALKLAKKKDTEVRSLCVAASSPPPREEKQTGLTDMGWIIEGATKGELAAYDAGCDGMMAALRKILDGKDVGFGHAKEPWETLRRRVIALVAPKTLRMLTPDEVIESIPGVKSLWTEIESIQRAFFAKNADALAGFVLGEEAG